MRNALQLRRTAAVFACAASLAGGAVAVGPSVATARVASTNCGSKTIPTKSGGKTVKVAASRIKVEGGATCADAFKVIRGVVLDQIPKGWKILGGGSYEVPRGLTAHVLVHGREKVEFALVGR